MPKINDKSQIMTFAKGFAILMLGMLMSSCTPELRHARTLGVKKGDLERLLIVTDQEGRETVKRTKGYRTVTRTVTGVDQEIEEYERMAKLSPGKFHGPYFTRDSAQLYYHRVLSVSSEPYIGFAIAQIHQTFGVGDSTFTAKLTKIANACAEGNIPLEEVLKDYSEDKDIRVGTIFTREEELLEKLIPEIRGFLRTADVFDVSISGKANYTHTTITELLQKMAEPTYHEHIKFARVTVLKRIEEK
jgi:hypothetical protein